MRDMKPKFKIGDVVRLKSGGPLMTVESVNDSPTYNILMPNTVICVYFLDSNYHMTWKHVDMLELVQ